jgi:hypothetical protein
MIHNHKIGPSNTSMYIQSLSFPISDIKYSLDTQLSVFLNAAETLYLILSYSYIDRGQYKFFLYIWTRLTVKQSILSHCSETMPLFYCYSSFTCSLISLYIQYFNSLYHIFMYHMFV